MDAIIKTKADIFDLQLQHSTIEKAINDKVQELNTLLKQQKEKKATEVKPEEK